MSVIKDFSNYPLAFGGASISGEGAGYGFGDITENDAIDLLLFAYDLGFRVFDSAPIYGFGLSEKRMGLAFKKNREKVFLVSKSGVTWAENKRVDMSNDPLVTEKMLIQSLKDFNTEYIDLYMIHWPDARVDIRRPLEVLAKAKAQGKIKHIGLCNTTQDDFLKASEVDKIEVVQSQLNLFEQNILKEDLPFFHQQGADFMSWGTLDKGILTGRVKRGRKFDSSDCRSWAPWWKQMDLESRFKAMDKIQPILEKFGHTGLEMALSFNLSHPEVSVALCGGRTMQQLEELDKALKNPLRPEILKEIKELATLS
ncbi:MAG: aldo/keto reductase [Bacteriovoracaceae bacterium]|nr:aldo/keto reductase [Bacteriovoracaceae bacterium]